jgi:hypothetical protein
MEGMLATASQILSSMAISSGLAELPTGEHGGPSLSAPTACNARTREAMHRVAGASIKGQFTREGLLTCFRFYCFHC